MPGFKQQNAIKTTSTSARIKTEGSKTSYGRLEPEPPPGGQGHLALLDARQLLLHGRLADVWGVDILGKLTAAEPARTLHGPGYSGGEGIAATTPPRVHSARFHVYAIERVRSASDGTSMTFSMEKTPRVFRREPTGF